MSEKYITENLKTPIRYECDTVVAGGGTAGIVAAIAAARNGARTILIDRYGFLGGTLVNGAGPLHSFFNLYKAFEGVEKLQVVRGIPSEIIERMKASGGSPGHLDQDKGGNYDSVITLIDWEIFKDVAFQMLEECKVKVLLHTMVSDVVKEGNVVKGVIIEGKSGREAVLAKTVIDTTGDGDVAALAGAGFKKKHDTTSVGMPFGMLNVDMPRLVKFLEERDMITQLIRADKGSETDNILRLGFDLKRIPVFKEFMDKTGMWGPLGFSMYEGNFTYINSATLRNIDATDTEILSNAAITLRHQVMTFAKMLKEHIPGFEKAYVNWTPASIGVRYTRVVECEHDMSLEEIVEGKRFDDEVMLYGFHDCAPRIMIKNGGYYGIPYRALLPKKIDGLLVAGRLITSEWEAHMSTRNTVSCMAQGQAVGTAAAICAKEGILPRELDVKSLQQVLREQKVFLG
ncbi:FAD-dependent oxidoreductase [Anaerocolumna sedimenticola]|uniref:FAD-dependent oxidoreductase n=1 Tax=Anaerocolumna sedimenticola TaxID=2696063 RepID=A0A6P1TK28_9FIRM|nr:FAD-dependent oxidoreductase [Anaerocolumna sedimenticola]QHQ59628.1 FAD-dependent oxidoreductase [Anaerocolumna sedimenticola]